MGSGEVAFTTEKCRATRLEKKDFKTFIFKDSNENSGSEN
jgi:hypothetical protein